MIEIDGKLGFCCLTPTIEKTFHIMGLAQYAPIFPDETTAVGPDAALSSQETAMEGMPRAGTVTHAWDELLRPLRATRRASASCWSGCSTSGAASTAPRPPASTWRAAARCEQRGRGGRPLSRWRSRRGGPADGLGSLRFPGGRLLLLAPAGAAPVSRPPAIP